MKREISNEEVETTTPISNGVFGDNKSLTRRYSANSATYDPILAIERILEETFTIDLEKELREFEEFFSEEETEDPIPVVSRRLYRNNLNVSKQLEEKPPPLTSSSEMRRVSAYDMFGEPVAPPPPEDLTEIELEETAQPIENGVYSLASAAATEEQARTAFLSYVSKRICYGSSAANQCPLTPYVVWMPIIISSFQYLLESFTETRSSKFVESPYDGDQENTPHVDEDSIPEPWKIDIQPPNTFEDSATHVAVPNSEQIKTCAHCQGNCKITCSFCDGVGSTTCLECGISSSMPTNEEEGSHQCAACKDTGRKGCPPCSESGQITCDHCSGKGRLKSHIEVVVIWKNNWDDFIVDYASAVPEKVLREMEGKYVFKEENRKRHQVRVIPMSEVKYTWKNKQYNFFVYGENLENAYAPKYPQRFLCCTVM
uniref:Uncharacterized protein LOC100370826 n=1 Tax=Saccoglossus kowalevskii TaxID=10224 RepID=A0ABM0MRA7_SACKO|nr:PREDICTED: uncharacterized protein LOC100370826 [Saccoglossus kowalevskii]